MSRPKQRGGGGRTGATSPHAHITTTSGIPGATSPHAHMPTCPKPTTGGLTGSRSGKKTVEDPVDAVRAGVANKGVVNGRNLL